MAEIGHSQIAMNVSEESCINRDADSKAEEESSAKRQAVGTLPDRLSELPDSLILDILGLLDCTKEAVKTSALSKRWRYLWNSVQSLNFSCHQTFHDESYVYDFVSFVSKTLMKCNIDVKLSSFKLYFQFDQSYQKHMDLWTRYAVHRKVQELEIDVGDGISYELELLLPQHLFVNSTFTELRLSLCLLEPNRPIEWKMLKVLCISDSPLTEDLIENILSGSPLLESLELTDCYGFNRLDITSTSVKRLVFDGYSAFDELYDECDDIVEVNAPNILLLDITGMFFVWKVLLLDMSSVVVANLNYVKCGKSDKETKEEMLKGFIRSLHHIKELTVGGACSKVLSRLQAKGFSFPENMKFPVGFATPICDRNGDSLKAEDMEDFNVDHQANIDEAEDNIGHGHGGIEVDHGPNVNDVNHGSNGIEVDNVPDDNEIDH